MNGFKPGVLCIIVRHDAAPDRVGKIITCLTVPRHMPILNGITGAIHHALGVEVHAPWQPRRPVRWAMPVAWLRPLNDPDVHLDTVNELLADANQEAMEAALEKLTLSYER